MKLSETMKTALIAATDGEVSARPNTLRALAARDLVAVVDGRAALTDEGKAVAAELRGEDAPATPSTAFSRRTPSDVWTITDRADTELVRVYGEYMADASAAAREYPEVREASRRDGGFQLRRLFDDELTGAEDAPELETYMFPGDAARVAAAFPTGTRVTGTNPRGAEVAGVVTGYAQYGSARDGYTTALEIEHEETTGDYTMINADDAHEDDQAEEAETAPEDATHSMFGSDVMFRITCGAPADVPSARTRDPREVTCPACREDVPEAFGSPVFAETVLRAALDTPQPAPLPSRPSGRNAIADAGKRFRTPLPVGHTGISVGTLVTVPRVADRREVTGTVTEVFDSGHARPVRVVTVRDPRGVEYAGLYAEAVAVKRVHFTVDLGTHRVACRETGPGKYIASQRERDVTCPACREVLHLR